MEMWEPDEPAKELIQQGVEDSVLREHAISAEMTTMVEDGLEEAQGELRAEIPYLHILAHAAGARALSIPNPS